MPPDQATSLLKARLEIAVEDLRYDDPKVDAWERVTKKIVERTFGERSQNANHFAVTLSYARQSEDEKQAWHVQHIKEKKDLLRAFIEELEIIPPFHPHNPDYQSSNGLSTRHERAARRMTGLIHWLVVSWSRTDKCSRPRIEGRPREITPSISLSLDKAQGRNSRRLYRIHDA